MDFLTPIYKTTAIFNQYQTTAGNLVIINQGKNEFSFFAYLKNCSVRVSVGQRVEQGEVIGLLGNSGNSDASHLHYHLMDHQDVGIRFNSLCKFTL
ncbi:MAG: hypothetical protein A2381_16310 [Bdellovibrionales bacterium RIFOXYB1_FULL_37_110]|nr:MAG: hypothetical protein A2181_06415 [Bdellovibrionales bacterium RIFOXYA1_FULL_38_20]OFZ48505.1 MAG: hypothetical protein A2417_04170 [Bdellovibrionales bacterium RIFOXYC1_FULL_37_79]OFZ57184.1 MAG: hypothetical protein A2381_16310 [Bdellovibrionales bacterium RIFOXYB1_FULL_37_110]OFZ63163.1 MAG: hypothetical protein A2577_15810 [Bdellovibrionales bacterium RIFOXYD1_FULL_36_51]